MNDAPVSPKKRTIGVQVVRKQEMIDANSDSPGVFDASDDACKEPVKPTSTDEDSVVDVQAAAEVSETSDTEDEEIVLVDESDDESNSVPDDPSVVTDSDDEAEPPVVKEPVKRGSFSRIPPGKSSSFGDDDFPAPRAGEDDGPRRGVRRQVSFDGMEGRLGLSTLDDRTKPKRYASFNAPGGSAPLRRTAPIRVASTDGPRRPRRVPPEEVYANEE